MSFVMRPYQDDLISLARLAVGRGSKRVILHAPTGGGKTAIASQIISSAKNKGSKVIFLANRRELVF